VRRLRLAVAQLMPLGVPRQKAVWVMPFLISCVGNHQGMKLALVLIRIIMVTKMSGGQKIKRSLMVKVLKGILEIMIKGTMMAIRVLVMVMLVVIGEIIDIDVRIEITIIISLGTGIISAICLDLMAPMLIVKEGLMRLRCSRHLNCQRLPWRWCLALLLQLFQALLVILVMFQWLLLG
jgi:hypothetical protein